LAAKGNKASTEIEGSKAAHFDKKMVGMDRRTARFFYSASAKMR
jgi:hypothetical protein